MTAPAARGVAARTRAARRYIIGYAVARGAIVAWVVGATLALVLQGIAQDRITEPAFLGLSWGDVGAVPVLLLALALGSLEARLTIRRYRPKDDDVPRCRNCGYTLVGLPEARCPECGTAFEQRTESPRQQGNH